MKKSQTILACAILMSTASGCAMRWTESARRGVDAANDTTKALWAINRPKLLAKCIAAGQQCAGKGVEQKDCPEYTQCRGKVRSIVTAIAGLHQLVAAARASLGLLETGGEVWKNPGYENALTLTQKVLSSAVAISKAIQHFLEVPRARDGSYISDLDQPP